MIFFWLVMGHALCDYPLQGDFLAKGKNHINPIPGIPWYQCLFWHAMIHAGAVVLITHNIWFGLAELILHMLIDYKKSDLTKSGHENCPTCERSSKLDYNIDQILHVVCKLLYFIIINN